MGVEQIIVHENFNWSLPYDDIAILKLSSDIYLGGKQAQAVPLADPGSDLSEGDNVLVAGWGFLYEFVLWEHLQKITLPVISRSSCQSAYENFSDVTITENHICAGGNVEGQGTCVVSVFEKIVIIILINHTLIYTYFV